MDGHGQMERNNQSIGRVSLQGTKKSPLKVAGSR